VIACFNRVAATTVGRHEAQPSCPSSSSETEGIKKQRTSGRAKVKSGGSRRASSGKTCAALKPGCGQRGPCAISQCDALRENVCLIERGAAAILTKRTASRSMLVLPRRDHIHRLVQQDRRSSRSMPANFRPAMPAMVSARGEGKSALAYAIAASVKGHSPLSLRLVVRPRICRPKTKRPANDRGPEFLNGVRMRSF